MSQENGVIFFADDCTGWLAGWLDGQAWNRVPTGGVIAIIIVLYAYVSTRQNALQKYVSKLTDHLAG